MPVQLYPDCPIRTSLAAVCAAVATRTRTHHKFFKLRRRVLLQLNYVLDYLWSTRLGALGPDVLELSSLADSPCPAWRGGRISD